jgi:hypothetical protein
VKDESARAFVRSLSMLVLVALTQVNPACTENDCDGNDVDSSCCPSGDHNPGGCNACRCNCHDGDCIWLCTAVGCDTGYAGPYPFSETRIAYQGVPDTTHVNDLDAFIPAWCASKNRKIFDNLGQASMDCPELNSRWPCRAFVEPPPSANGLTPATPLLLAERSALDFDALPADCACEQALSFSLPAESAAATPRYCRSLVGLSHGEPFMIDSLEALRTHFAPVETHAEALAFAELVAVGLTAGHRLIHLADDDSLPDAGFPISEGNSEPLCRDNYFEGTSVVLHNGMIGVLRDSSHWRVRLFAVGTTCSTAGLYVFEVDVTYDGDITLAHTEELCWYEEAPCED